MTNLFAQSYDVCHFHPRSWIRLIVQANGCPMWRLSKLS
jgi:hypothetical protein